MKNCELFVEFCGTQINTKTLTDTAKELWKVQGNKVKDLHELKLYYKPEEKKCYYTMNGEAEGCFDVTTS